MQLFGISILEGKFVRYVEILGSPIQGVFTDCSDTIYHVAHSMLQLFSQHIEHFRANGQTLEGLLGSTPFCFSHSGSFAEFLIQPLIMSIAWQILR